MARDVMIFGRANPFRGPLEGVGPKNLVYLGAKLHIAGPRKVSIGRAHPFQWSSKWICPHQNHFVSISMGGGGGWSGTKRALIIREVLSYDYQATLILIFCGRGISKGFGTTAKLN
jgi:hypothetical protein